MSLQRSSFSLPGRDGDGWDGPSKRDAIHQLVRPLSFSGRAGKRPNLAACRGSDVLRVAQQGSEKRSAIAESADDGVDAVRTPRRAYAGAASAGGIARRSAGQLRHHVRRERIARARR